MIGTERSDINGVALIAAEAHQVAGFIAADDENHMGRRHYASSPQWHRPQVLQGLGHILRNRVPRAYRDIRSSFRTPLRRYTERPRGSRHAGTPWQSLRRPASPNYYCPF